MIKTNWIHRCAVHFALVALFLGAAPSYGAVTADPASVTFLSPGQSFTVKLSNDGVPISGKDIREWQFLASGHDYKHMVDVEKMNGAVKISPSGTVELGSYDLNIETTQGAVVVRVLMPLSDVPDVVERIAELTGQSEQKVAEKMGLTSTSGRSEVQLDLPPVFYEGQTLTLTMTAKPADGHSAQWFINGDAVAEGPDPYALNYTFLDAGDYIVTFIETATVDGAQVIAAHAESYTRVVSIPAVTNHVTVNTTVTYLPPNGYGNHSWSVDGNPVSKDPELIQKFVAPGTHVVECLASAPDEGPATGFQRVRYNTTVNPV